MTGLKQCNRQFARRKPAIERVLPRPWLFKLDGDLTGGSWPYPVLRCGDVHNARTVTSAQSAAHAVYVVQRCPTLSGVAGGMPMVSNPRRALISAGSHSQTECSRHLAKTPVVTPIRSSRHHRTHSPLFTTATRTMPDGCPPSLCPAKRDVSLRPAVQRAGRTRALSGFTASSAWRIR